MKLICNKQLRYSFQFYKVLYLLQIFIIYSLYFEYLTSAASQPQSSMSQQPYYFELVPRNMLTRQNQKDHGSFKFYIQKNSQRVDFNKVAFRAVFTERRMKINHSRLNFFLPNYFPGKNYNSKFIFSLTQQIYTNNQKPVGSYTIDPNIYIEQFKRNGRNYFTQIWDLSDDYSVEIELFFDQSKYALEKLMMEYRDKPATSFGRPLVSKAIEQAKKAQIQEDKEYDDEERYNDQRMKLFNKYAGALVGNGGYRIFEEESEKIVKKESEHKKTSNNFDKNKNEPISTPSRSKLQEKPKQNVNSNLQSIKKEGLTTPTKQTVNTHETQNPQAQMKNLKFLIIGILILILLGSGYFLTKIFLRDQTQSIQVPESPKQPKRPSEASKKAKAKASKKSKSQSQL